LPAGTMCDSVTTACLLGPANGCNVRMITEKPVSLLTCIDVTVLQPTVA
jgi:hypothetical protein